MTSMLGSDDLNDFIKPSVACIKTSEEAVIQLEIEDDENNQEKKKEKERTQVSISLEDCLACSGCITSSEEILIKQHDSSKFVEYWEENSPTDEMIYVMVVSDQSRLSISKEFNKSIEDIDGMIIESMQQRFQIKYFVGTGIGREIGHHELYQEVKSRKNGKVPVLSSVCPGWRLYVEKTHNELVENLSRVKTPQWITGALVREVIKMEKPNAKVCVLTLMPCFDKKLEASRDDIVDFVVTPRELISLVDLTSIEGLKIDDYEKYAPPHWPKYNQSGWGGVITSNDLTVAVKSGGWALAYVERACIEENAKIAVVQGKNEDVVELQAVRESDGTVVARAGIINGFKNIQNGVRKWKGTERKRRGIRGKTANEGVSITQWDLAEVMACPGGCLNGGGQLPNKDKALEGLTSKETEKREEIVAFAHSICVDPLEGFHERQTVDVTKAAALPDVFSSW